MPVNINFNFSRAAVVLFFAVCRKLYASYKTYHINKVFVVYKID